MSKQRACSECKRIIKKGNKKCPICKSNDLTKKWRGKVTIFDPEESEIADKLDIDSSGEYSIKIKK